MHRGEAERSAFVRSAALGPSVMQMWEEAISSSPLTALPPWEGAESQENQEIVP